jgi:hypothetical protein
MSKLIYIVFPVFVFISCKEERVFPDLCIGCTFSVQINNQDWDGAPHSSNYVSFQNEKDTSFTMVIRERNPVHDEFHDSFIFYQLPYDTGFFVLDTFDLLDNSGIKAEFWVFEYEHGTPSQEYSVIPDGESYIHIELLDKVNRTFVLSFHLKMTIPGGVNGPLYNSSYPKVITFSEGRASGQINER